MERPDFSRMIVCAPGTPVVLMEQHVWNVMAPRIGVWHFDSDADSHRSVHLVVVEPVASILFCKYILKKIIFNNPVMCLRQPFDQWIKLRVRITLKGLVNHRKLAVHSRYLGLRALVVRHLSGRCDLTGYRRRSLQRRIPGFVIRIRCTCIETVYGVTKVSRVEVWNVLETERQLVHCLWIRTKQSGICFLRIDFV